MLLKTVLDSLFTLVQLRNEDPQRAAAVNLSLVRAFGQAHARPPCLLAPQGNLTSVRKNGVNRLLLNVSGRGVSRGSGRIRRGAIRRGIDAGGSRSCGITDRAIGIAVGTGSAVGSSVMNGDGPVPSIRAEDLNGDDFTFVLGEQSSR